MDLKNKKVLITGADGFIGSHLVELLLNQSRQVKAFVYYNAFNSWGWLDDFSRDQISNIEVVSGDIRDPKQIREAVSDADIVFHLAALIAIPFSYQAPDSYVDTNIRGTLNVLQACRDSNTEGVVVTSTSEVYGTARYVPIDEGHPLQPQSPYSATKIGADALAESFFRSFGLPVKIARPFNTYGPRQSARAVIPTIITQLLNGSSQVKLGSLHPTRDLNFVTDICGGLIAIAKCGEAVGRVINIGSGQEVSVGEVAQSIIEKINPNAAIVTEAIRTRPDKSEVDRLLCDNRLLRELTGWEPSVLLEDGISRTIEWYSRSENLKRYKSNIYNV